MRAQVQVVVLAVSLVSDYSYRCDRLRSMNAEPKLKLVGRDVAFEWYDLWQ